MSPTVICCGLNCIDLELHNAQVPSTLEAVTTFSHTTFTPGGSAPQTSTALVTLQVETALLTLVGDDPHGKTLQKMLLEAHVDVSGIQVSGETCTSMAVLPLFVDGRRGCFVTLGANNVACAENLLPRSVMDTLFTASLRIFHFGYPHLMPQLQGKALCQLFERVREGAPHVLLTLDVNGADTAERQENPVLLPALEYTAAIHANLDEACVITGMAPPSSSDTMPAEEVKPIVEWFVKNGAGMSCITCGKDGVFVATRFKDNPKHNLSPHLENGAFIYRGAYKVTDGVTVNASGAGDAFVAGILSELAESAGKRGVARVTDSGLVSALKRIDSKFSPENANVSTLLERAKDKDRIPARDTLKPLQYAVE
ncbi:putative sugar kinase YdjH [Gracilariopsis chorda]|uniref:Putative sugar kinase YdjH n=1 Tax=Gracilariopsis chorda TaxID=448386 RepID=A0A2V3IYT4_9FLOR|nr:putative sugar kinase YdjH [Gracilariopsis chorda]|eukprot:PXF47223.1 putative sugar kinase YdjH [Gracilariopsis chorda]